MKSKKTEVASILKGSWEYLEITNPRGRPPIFTMDRMDATDYKVKLVTQLLEASHKLVLVTEEISPERRLLYYANSSAVKRVHNAIKDVGDRHKRELKIVTGFWTRDSQAFAEDYLVLLVEL
jgi:hypothetical protein